MRYEIQVETAMGLQTLGAAMSNKAYAIKAAKSFSFANDRDIAIYVFDKLTDLCQFERRRPA